MSRRSRELVGDWLTVLGSLALLASLFLTWSHQFSAAFLAEWGASDVLRGVPHDPTAWQVYSTADVLLAALAVALVGTALLGRRALRGWMAAAVAVALGFTLHALAKPPSNGANIFNPALSVPSYFPNSPAAGVGETVALAGLGMALVGLLLSFTGD